MAEVWSDTRDVPMGYAQRTPWVDVSGSGTVTVKCTFQDNRYSCDTYIVWSDDPTANIPELQNIFTEWYPDNGAPNNKIAYWVPSTPRVATYIAVYVANPLYDPDYWRDVRLTTVIETP